MYVRKSPLQLVERALALGALSAAFFHSPVGLNKAFATNPPESSYSAGIPEALDLSGPTQQEEPIDTGICPLTKFSVYEFHWLGGVRRDPLELTAAGQELSCLQTQSDIAIDRCLEAVPVADWWRDLDDCVILGYLMHIEEVVNRFHLQDVPLRPASIEGALNDPNWYFRKVSCTFRSSGNGTGICKQGTLFFDDECNSVANPTAEQVARSCDGGNFFWATPISLVWEENADIDKEISFAKFPLEPGAVGKYYTWKGSEQTPLLVYDPAHSGNITTAAQLFGNWTFGGKQSAALHDSPDSANLEPRAWRDGFEALASLDANHDGNLNGTELSDLGLWFDKNRDGVSSPGEVISLQSSGVTRLSTTSNKVDAATKTIFALKGFDRQTSKGKMSGTMADWYGESAPSQMELINRQTLRQNLCDPAAASIDERSVAAPTVPADIASAEQKESQTESEFKPGSNLSGLWKFRIVSDDAGALKNESGLISFNYDGEKGLNGYTVVEVPVDSLGKGLHRMVEIQGFTGERYFSVSQNVIGKFSLIRDKDSKSSTTDSKVVLSRDGKSLDGESKTQMQRNGKPTVFTYRWIAERIS